MSEPTTAIKNLTEGYVEADGSVREVPVTLTIQVEETWVLGANRWGKGTVTAVVPASAADRYLGTKQALHLGRISTPS